MKETRNRIARHLTALMAPVVVLTLMVGGALFMGCNDTDAPATPPAASQGEVRYTATVNDATSNTDITNIASFKVGVTPVNELVFTQTGDYTITATAPNYSTIVVTKHIVVTAGVKTVEALVFPLAPKVTIAVPTAVDNSVAQTVTVVNQQTQTSVASVEIPALAFVTAMTIEVNPAPAAVNPDAVKTTQEVTNNTVAEMSLGSVEVKITTTTGAVELKQPITVRVRASALGISAALAAQLTGKTFPVRVTHEGSSINVNNATCDGTNIIFVLQPGEQQAFTRQGGSTTINVLVLSGVNLVAGTKAETIVESIQGGLDEPFLKSWVKPALTIEYSDSLLQLLVEENFANTIGRNVTLTINRPVIQDFFWIGKLLQRTQRLTVVPGSAGLGDLVVGEYLTKTTYGTDAVSVRGTGGVAQ